MKRVLLVDDQAEISTSIAEWLQLRGYSCECCHTGKAALRRFEVGGYSAVLLDVHLGGGLTGIEIGQRIRSRDAEVVLVVFSAVHYSPLVQRAVHDIGGIFVEKPVDMKRLEEVMGFVP
jgi:DNA-binding response OmpR family regulator